MIYGVTGHRPDKLGGYSGDAAERMREKLTALFEERFNDDAERVLTGMALGVDTIAAQVCVKLGVPFVACLPFIGQESRWDVRDIAVYQGLLEKADEVVYVSPGEFAGWKYQKRNEYIVDNCEKLLAVWDGSRGGTNNCVTYARSVKREILWVNPKELG